MGSRVLVTAAGYQGDVLPFVSIARELVSRGQVVPFAGAEEAWVAAWLRPLGDEPIDAAWLVTMCDLLPPAVFSRTTSPVKAASIEYVVHLVTGESSVPAGEYVYLSCRSPLANEGFAVEDATMWAPTAPCSPSPAKPVSPAREHDERPTGERRRGLH